MNNFLLRTIFFSIGFILLVNCDDFKCPSIGTKKGKKVPDILKLIDKQNGYYSTVEVNNEDRENLVHEYFNVDSRFGFVDLQAMRQDGMNRRYYYHDTEEKIAVLDNRCARMDLTQSEKVESIKDWFEPADIVEKSEIFKEFLHFGPSVLMIYANSIGDKASFIGTELIDGRSIDHWFYCIEDAGPYIDFYFDTENSFPYRFSLYYPKSETFGNETVQTEEGRHSSYVYNFFIFKPLVISPYEPMPYPVSYGCARKDSKWQKPLPEFTSITKFTLDMEAVITYPNGEIIKSTARVMKHRDVYSYEITESEGTTRSIENPPPLGRWEVDEFTGSCKYYTSDYQSHITLVTRWPFFKDRGFNLLYYIVMKPTTEARPSYVGTFDLGPEIIEEYRAKNFIRNSIDAIVDYHYPVSNSSTDPDNVPAKIVFTKDRSQNYITDTPDQIEVTIIDFRRDYFDFEDRFDVSGCYEDFGMYTWFQLVFSNPSLSSTSYNLQILRSEVHEFLTEFIPITRISDIVINPVDYNFYVNVKLLDRIHFIEAYRPNQDGRLENPDMIVKSPRIEDCEQACTSNPACFEFSYCPDFTCSMTTSNGYTQVYYEKGCTHYSVEFHNEASDFVKQNFLSSMKSVLHQIRRKIDQDLLVVRAISSSAEELFIVHGPEEIGDLTEQQVGDFDDLPNFFQGDEYPLIQPDRRLNSGIATLIKIDYLECLSLCENDDDCNSLSYCPNQNKECILSSETTYNLETSTETLTDKAEGCNIYEKSFTNYFTKYPGKSLDVDAAAIKEGIEFTDCAKECLNTKDFNCESFDYCSSHFQKNDSVCFLHVNHLTADPKHSVNITNWKIAESGCDHFSKKADHDYRHIVAHQFSPATQVIGTYEELPLEECAAKCNSNPVNCYTFEYCEKPENLEDDSGDMFYFTSIIIKSTCRLSNFKPTTISNTNDPEFRKYFDKSLSDETICSIYVNQEKISKSSGNKDKLNIKPEQKDRTSLAFGFGSFFFILAFAIGAIGFIYAQKNNLINI
ncbi:uncharacterized protein LOC128392176 [Panonychus citri]|uniref:uncharacterized protein LOC128392176 n=1 Tax=Panonychus citri TaxID=50023 RepID=UPI0023082392|nr:uncharacterized protein LOC128392176 [Panonychus citri]